jgi:DNA polymerase-4
VTLKLRTTDFKIRTRRRTLPAATQTARTLFAVGRELLTPELGAPFRLIGIGVSDLCDADQAEGDLFAGDETRARKGERAVDALRDKFGQAAVVSARALRSHEPTSQAGGPSALPPLGRKGG